MSAFDPAWLNTIDQIYHYGWSSRKLLRIRLLKRSIAHFWPSGYPVKLVHVAGSNGKGSVCRLLQAALRTQGCCGAWVNPHLFDWGERFRLGDELASRTEIISIWEELILPHSLDRAEKNTEHALTFAEAGLLIALHLFSQHKLPWAVLETGVGGRYAPTMAVQPDLCLLTNVGNDHPHTLGTEPWQVALEKSGIARPGIPFISMEDGDAEPFVQQSVKAGGGIYSGLAEAQRQEITQLLAAPEAGQKSRHWLSNAALALAAARQLLTDLCPESAVRAMVGCETLQGRFWQVQEGVLADVAHNEDKLRALAADLKQHFPGQNFRFLLGVSRNRKAAQLFAPLKDLATEFFLTEASYAGQNPTAIAADLGAAGFTVPLRVLKDPAKALNLLMAERQPGELIVISGSAYTIDQALNPDPWLKQLNREFGRRGNSPELA